MSKANKATEIIEYKTWEELAEPLAERGVDLDLIDAKKRAHAVTWWGWYGYPAVLSSSGDEMWQAFGGPTMDRLASFLNGNAGRIYVAGRVREIERVRMVQRVLFDAGFEITYDWTADDVPDDRSSDEAILSGRAITEKARHGIRSADAVVVLWPLPSQAHHGVGLLIESGIALEAKKPLVVSGPSIDSSFWSDETTVRVKGDGEILIRVQQAVTTLEEDPLLG